MKPIIFSTPMVNAILDGRKNQTRRVAKVPKETHRIDRDWNGRWWAYWVGLLPDGQSFVDGETDIKPSYKPGDIIWVREAWANDCQHCFASLEEYGYCADCHFSKCGTCIFKKRPSIHMPRAAARIFLRVTDVRVERVQEISESDAIAEGVTIPPLSTILGIEHIVRFKWLWDDINAKRNGGVYAWDENPWVWVYTFERVNEEGQP